MSLSQWTVSSAKTGPRASGYWGAPNRRHQSVWTSVNRPPTKHSKEATPNPLGVALRGSGY